MGRGQIQSKVFMYILASIILILVIFYTYKAITAFKDHQRRAILAELEEKLKTAVEIASSKFGYVGIETLRVPDGTAEVCFVDLNNTPGVLSSTLVDRYPVIKDSLESGSQLNMFLISDDGTVTESMYIGELCFDWPYYKCVKTPKNILKVAVEGKGNCVTIRQGLILLNITNKKNLDRYTGVTAFIVDREAGWQKNLKLTPIAMWNGNPGGTPFIVSYPLLIYNKNQGGVSDFMIGELIAKFGGAEVRHFGTLPAELIGNPNVTEQNYESDYVSYWSEINDIVVVDYENRDAGLIASLFASYLIAPILFLDDSHFSSFEQELLINKRVYIVDDIDDSVQDYIIENSFPVIKYDSFYIRDDAEINPYRRMMSNVYPIVI